MAIIAFLCSNRNLRVCVPLVTLWILDLSKPSKVFGPVDFPPCILQTDLPFKAGALHLEPLRLDFAVH